MITNEKIEQGWLRDPSLWEINVLKHLASTRLIEHLNPNCFLPLPLPLVLAISVPNKWRNSSALLELQLQCWWNLELCYYVTTTSLQPYGPNPHNLLTWYTPPSGAVAVPKKTAFSQRVRPFWRDTCVDLIMTLTVIGRNWLNPAHVLGWSYHFTKKNAPAVSTVPISLLTMWLNHKKLAKIVDLKISSCSFPPKPKSQAVLPKAQNFGSVVFGMCQLQFGWFFRRVCPSKCLAAFFFGEVEALFVLNSFTSTWKYRKISSNQKIFGNSIQLMYMFNTCSCFIDS